MISVETPEGWRFRPKSMINSSGVPIARQTLAYMVTAFESSISTGLRWGWACGAADWASDTINSFCFTKTDYRKIGFEDRLMPEAVANDTFCPLPRSASFQAACR
jgi:hypothetical protein